MTKLESTVGNKELEIAVLKTIELLNTIDKLPNTHGHDELVQQLIRYSISIGTHDVTAGSAKSTSEFVKKLKKQKIENDKTKEKLNVLLTTANQLLSIYSTSAKK